MTGQRKLKEEFKLLAYFQIYPDSVAHLRRWVTSFFFRLLFAYDINFMISQPKLKATTETVSKPK